jgi:hypothetical protein
MMHDSKMASSSPVERLGHITGSAFYGHVMDRRCEANFRGVISDDTVSARVTQLRVTRHYAA